MHRDCFHGCHTPGCQAPFHKRTFDLDRNDRWVLAAMFIRGSAEILSVLTSEQHRLVSHLLDPVRDSKPDMNLNGGVCKAVADQGDICAAAHNHRRAGQRVLGAIWKESFFISCRADFRSVKLRFYFTCSHSTSTRLTAEVIPGWLLREQV